MWTQQCWFFHVQKPGCKCFNQNFCWNISNISTSISRFDFYVCVFTLGDHTSYYLCVCKTWGLNFNHFNQWHFHQPPVMVPYYSHTTSHKNLFKIWEFLWEAHHFWGSHYSGQLADFFPLRSSMPVPKRQNGNKPCRSSAASDHRMDHRWMWRNTPRCSMLVEEAGVCGV